METTMFPSVCAGVAPLLLSSSGAFASAAIDPRPQTAVAVDVFSWIDSFFARFSLSRLWIYPVGRWRVLTILR
jgi:hypothetical protein